MSLSPVSMIFGRRALAVMTAALLAGSLSSAQSQSGYSITHTYVLGGEGGWDYVIPDPSQHRVFLARGNRIMVADEDTGKLLTEIKDIHGAHGIAIATGTGHGFATASEDKAVIMFDAKTYKMLKKIPAAEDADAILFDAPSNRVFSLNGDANSATVIDAATGNVVKNLPLGGKPEYGASAGNGKFYVNLVDKNEIVEIDTKAASVTRRWSTAPCKQPVSMAIDTKHRRLFSGCRSGQMAVSNYDDGKVVATLPIGKGVDGGGFDPASGNAFTSNGDGSLTVIHQDGPDQYRVVGSVVTPVGSRNMGLDPTNHKIFMVSAKFGPVPAGGRRGPVLPDSFALMVVEPDSAK